jgi:outer membrane protein assembly factor BamB
MKDFGAELPTWGFSGMPVVDGKSIILPTGGKGGDLVALDKKTGKLVWRSAELADNIHYSSPLLVEIGGVRQIVQLTGASVAGVRASDGKLLWRAARKGRTAMIPTPIYKDGEVYVATGYGIGCNLFKVKAEGGKFSVDEVYANKDMINHHGGVILVDKYVYGFCDGKGWTCMDFDTGKVVWKNPGVGKGSAVYADGLLYLRAENGDGKVAIIDASPDGYKELSKFNPPDRSDKNSWPHPVVTGGRMYLRDQDVLQCYDVKAK